MEVWLVSALITSLLSFSISFMLLNGSLTHMAIKGRGSHKEQVEGMAGKFLLQAAFEDWLHAF